MGKEEESTRFVDFWYYCKTCKNRNTKETDEPCNSCLEVPARYGTSKPEKYEEKG